MQKILFVFGTRPEAIKLAPVILGMQLKPEMFSVKICVTGQHKEMLGSVLDFFGIKPDFNLEIIKPDQTLFEITANCLIKLNKVLAEYTPDIIFVQGDTTTAFTGALAGYYKHIKVAHVEAGLRSGDKFSPFPEEINRTLIGHLSDFHFAPTELAVKNLGLEGIKTNVWNTTNTVIDALLLGLKIIESSKDIRKQCQERFSFLDFNKKIILLTAHRRESFGRQFRDICHAIKTIAKEHPEVEIVYPVHLNPNVQKPVKELLGDIPNIHLIKPLDYPYLIWLMKKSYIILTDSGGIQEEAPALGIPVLVLRNVTERTEGVIAGTAKLVGTNPKTIIDTTNIILRSKKAYEKMANSINPYGKGEATKNIIKIVGKNT